ncbi:MAG: tetratricopeptide repeat protein, partial [Planctomycetes bacterium]|nr:tetratricopeptide repeat protein [Planctomycetota bacterium]
VRLEPTFAEARNNLGAVLLGQGKLAEAEEQFERALEARPDFTEARRNLERTRALRRERGGR